MTDRPTEAFDTLPTPPPRAPLTLRPWPWSTTLVRGAIAVLLLRWLASRQLPAESQADASTAAWGALGVLVVLRWLAALPEGAERARHAGAAGRSWPARLAILLIPAELIGLLRLLTVTAGGCFAWLIRRPPPARPEGRRLEDRRKGFYDAIFAMNVVSFVPEILVSSLMLYSGAHPLWMHLAVHGLEVAAIVLMLGDRWLVHAGGHVLTPTHLDLRAGARAAAHLPLVAITAIEPLGKTRPEAWCRAHGVHRADSGMVSVLDRPNVVITLNPPRDATWSRWQVERPLPRHLFVYLDDPAALAPAVAAALTPPAAPA